MILKFIEIIRLVSLSHAYLVLTKKCVIDRIAYAIFLNTTKQEIQVLMEVIYKIKLPNLWMMSPAKNSDFVWYSWKERPASQ